MLIYFTNKLNLHVFDNCISAIILNLPRDSIMVPLINCATSIFCGCAIFTMLGFMAAQKGVDVPDVAAQGNVFN